MREYLWPNFRKGFPDSSVGKECACSAGDPWFDSWVGKIPGEGIGYPLQYSWASLVTQLVKNPSAMQESWVRSLGSSREDPLKKRKVTHSSTLSWRIPWTVSMDPLGPKSQTQMRVSLSILEKKVWLRGQNYKNINASWSKFSVCFLELNLFDFAAPYKV